MLFYINIDILNKTIKNVGDLFLHSRSCVVFLQIVLLARTLHVLQSLPSRKHPHKLHLIDKMNCRVNRKLSMARQSLLLMAVSSICQLSEEKMFEMCIFSAQYHLVRKLTLWNVSANSFWLAKRHFIVLRSWALCTRFRESRDVQILSCKKMDSAVQCYSIELQWSYTLSVELPQLN